MRTTTMDAAAQTSEHAAKVPASTEAPRGAMRRLVQPMTEVLDGMSGLVRWIWRFDLGATVLVGEQTARFVRAAVERGKEVEPTVTKPFRKAEGSVATAIGEVKTHLKGIAKPVSTVRGRSGNHRRDRVTRQHT